jgi:predicted phage terminase large subunit-like protein
MSQDEQRELLKLVEELEEAKARQQAKTKFLPFVRAMWPGFIQGPHHEIMAEAFDRVMSGDCKRLIINMPPRHTKSEFASFLLPAMFMGRFPEKKIIQATHTAELAVSFGRKTRNAIDSEDYKNIFSEVKLQSDSKAAGRWNTSKGGAYFAVGVGGAIAGKGADLFIIDDPHTEQEAIAALGDASVYDKVFDWYTSGPRQRLQPDARIVIVMCMTGDTPVLMADKTEKPLRDVRPGDLVATYEDGAITTANVANWKSSGVDSVFTIQTQSGRMIRANERHPFLVDFDGERKWIKLRDLRPGMLLVATKDATGQQDHKKNQEHARHVKQKHHTTKKIQTLHTGRLVSMENGKVSNVLAGNQFIQEECAFLATINNTMHQNGRQKKDALAASNTDMASLLTSILRWSMPAITFAMFVDSHRHKKTRARIGAENYVSTTATKQEKLEDYFATTATLRLDTAKRQRISTAPLNTCSVTLDQIVNIFASGKEEVFDVEIERTENFIANGVVSHNTRWAKRDLTGRLIQSSMERDGTSEWEVIELPALLPSGNPIWPGYWSKASLEALKSELPASKWNAQYQQQPTNEEGAILKREWWKRWQKSSPPDYEYVIITADTAFTKNNRSDYSAFNVWGVFEKEDDTGSFKSNIILLDAFKERMEFPALKARAKELYDEWQPDTFLIEGKASGLPLVHELRQMDIPVSEFTPTRASGDKIMRANSITDMFASGMVWCPETRWADEVVEECASFPNGAHDDYVDTVIMALMRYRQGGFIRLPSDYDEDEKVVRHRADYY